MDEGVDSQSDEVRNPGLYSQERTEHWPEVTAIVINILLIFFLGSMMISLAQTQRIILEIADLSAQTQRSAFEVATIVEEMVSESTALLNHIESIKAYGNPNPVSDWCSTGEPKWLEESGTARAVWFSDHTRRVTITGAEAAFDTFIYFEGERDDKGLGDVVRSIPEQQVVSYLIVCHGSWYELQAIAQNDNLIWPTADIQAR